MIQSLMGTQARKGRQQRHRLSWARSATRVAAGIVSNLARPRGNVTGFSSQSLELEGKRLEIMRDLLPGIERVVTLGNTPNRYIDLAIDSVERLATAAGLKFDGVKIDSVNGLGRGLDLVRNAHPDAVLVAAATASLI
jgi:putative ABC transport system substrate-binding protein